MLDKMKENISRDDLFSLLKGYENVGVELGVALGDFSLTAIKSKKFKLYIGVDSYDLGPYNIKHYKECLKKTNFPNNNYNLLKMRFDQAIDLFDDNSLDFIYFDGFAHNGQLGGKTIIDWYPKVKIGGIVAGDDYHDQWPLVKSAVNDISSQLKVDLNITKISKKNEYSEFPSWYFYKMSQKSIEINKSLIKKSIIRDKLDIYLRFIYFLRKFLVIFLKKILPSKIIDILKRSK